MLDPWQTVLVGRVLDHHRRTRCAPIRFGHIQQQGTLAGRTPRDRAHPGSRRQTAPRATYGADPLIERRALSLALEQVVRFYSTRDGASPLGHPSTLLQPLQLSETEVGDLVAFLRALGAGDGRAR